MGKIISLWSGPRNISTALMYSFSQRSDLRVVDEPLYASYLLKTGADHPGRDEVIASMPGDPTLVWEQCRKLSAEQHVFLKNMAHHAIGLDEKWYVETVPLFLIRDPHEMLPSLGKVLSSPSIKDTGLDRQVELVRNMRSSGRTPLIIEGSDILRAPQTMLEKICFLLDLPYEKGMLSWPSGPNTADGVWAKYWYHQVHKSTGFSPKKQKSPEIPEKLEPLLEECLPCYYELKSLKIE